MKKTYIFVLAVAVGLYCAPAFAQHGHGAGGPGGMGSANAMNGSSHANSSASGAGGNASSAGASSGKTLDQLLTQNTKLSDKISALTGESAQQSCTGFKNLGQCVATAHVSKNLGISFDCLKSGMTATQALEYDLFQFISGREFMFGSQCGYASGYWDVWNQGAGTWVQTQLPCQKFLPNVWHHIVWQMHRTSDQQMHYDSLTLDGIQNTLNVAEPSGPLPTGWTDNLGVQGKWTPGQGRLLRANGSTTLS